MPLGGIHQLQGPPCKTHMGFGLTSLSPPQEIQAPALVAERALSSQCYQGTNAQLSVRDHLASLPLQILNFAEMPTIMGLVLLLTCHYACFLEKAGLWSLTLQLQANIAARCLKCLHRVVSMMHVAAAYCLCAFGFLCI